MLSLLRCQECYNNQWLVLLLLSHRLKSRYYDHKAGPGVRSSPAAHAKHVLRPLGQISAHLQARAAVQLPLEAAKEWSATHITLLRQEIGSLGMHNFPYQHREAGQKGGKKER
jgi:hypothetical protein